MTSVKRYILLAGAAYYPNGWGDFQGAFDDCQEARLEGERLTSSPPGTWKSPKEDWYEVVDLTTMKVVH